MKKMRKFISIMLVLTLVLCTVAGCSSNTNDTSSSTGTEPTDTGTTTDNSNASEVIGAGSDLSGVGSADEETGKVSYWPDSYLRDKIVIATSSSASNFKITGRSGGWGSVELGYGQTLAAVDSEGNIHLQLLKRFDKVDDVTYEGELWDIIYDTEGVNMKASDVQWSVQMMIDNGDLGAVNRLDSIEVTGDYTFIWHCNQAFGLGEMGKNLSNVTVYCEESYNNSPDEFATTPIGTGPYKVDSWVAGSQLNLVANEDFWMKNIDDEEWLAENYYVTDAQNVREIQLDVIGDAANRAVAIEMGAQGTSDVIAVDKMNNADVNNYIANPDMGITPVRLPVTAPAGFYFNCNEASPCSDINLRKAICYAIDNVGYCSAVNSPAEPAYGYQPKLYDALESWSTGEGVDYYTYDLDTAKEYLEQSSYAGETLHIMYDDQGIKGDVAVLLQAALRELGITAELLPAEMSVLNDYRTDYDKWDLYFDTMGGGNYFKDTVKRLTTKEAAANNNGNQPMGIIDEHLDELFDELDANSCEETINAWHDYFIYEMCYGYSIMNYYDQTACLDSVNVVLSSSQNKLVPGAFTYND
jgi:ABC-type transport system substrate-binding protein